MTPPEKTMTSPEPLRVEEVRSAGKLEAHRDAWNQLVEDSTDPDISQTYEWMTSWLDSFWTNKPISFLFVWKGKKLGALFPLLHDRQGEFWCKGSLVLRANPHSTRREVLCVIDLHEALDATLAHLQRSRGNVQVGWKRLRQDSEVAQGLEAALRRGTLMSVGVTSCDVPVVHFEGDWDSAITERAPRLREIMIEDRQRMEEEGEVEWIVAHHKDQIDRAMRDVLTIESQNWRAAANTPYDSNPGIAAFHDEFSRRSVERQWHRIYVLYLESHPISYIYGAVFRGEYCSLKASHDGRYSHLSPGEVLFGIALEDIRKQGFKALDLQGGPARWKRELAGGMRRQVNVCTASEGRLRCEACRIYYNHVKPAGRAQLPALVSRP